MIWVQLENISQLLEMNKQSEKFRKCSKLSDWKKNLKREN